MKHRHISLVLFAGIVSIAVICNGLGLRSFAQGQPQNYLPPNEPIPQTHMGYQMTGTTPDGWGWTKQAWTADNSKYAALRAQIDSKLTAGVELSGLLASMKSAAEKAPNDPLKEFGYGYAAWRLAMRPSTPLPIVYRALRDVPDALASARFPNTLDYARLRFLCETKVHYGPDLLLPGKRLHELLPHDRDVTIFYVEALAYSRTRANLDAARLLDTEMMVNDPSDPSLYLLQSTISMESYWLTHDQKDKNAEIEAARSFLRVAPADDSHRPAIEHYLAVVDAGTTK